MDSSALSVQRWRAYAKGLIKGEIIRQNISPADLAERMRRKGIGDYSDEQVERRLSRGDFSAIFLLQALSALDIKEIDINHIHKALAQSVEVL